MRQLLSRLGLTRRSGLGRALGASGAERFEAQQRLAHRVIERLEQLRAQPGDAAFAEALRTARGQLAERSGKQRAGSAARCASGEAAAKGKAGQEAPTAADDAARDAARVEALALAAEAMRRSIGLDPFPQQLVTALALDDGLAVEMATGEGKTAAGSLAAALAGLAGRHAQVLTVNDYLAERDAADMGPFLAMLGLRSASITSRSDPRQRRLAYRADVTYSPVAELGYDVLRDRLAEEPGELLAPRLDIAIVDEIDAVLIDDAMTPLVLAGESEVAVEHDPVLRELIERHVREGRYETDAERANAWFTEEALEDIERELGTPLHDAEHAPLLSELHLGLHARVLLERDVHYIVTDGGIQLIDAARGRVAHLQRWPDGLHAAVEAKEGLTVSRRSVVLDSLTIQELLGGFARIAGMSGTVLPVAGELREFYGLESGRVERRLPLAREKQPERVHPDREQRDDALMEETLRRHREGQPVLIGTQSISESERIARLLRRAKLRPVVLNAKNDADEAAVIARAGEPGAVTISTQISGRGVDILLGGGDEELAHAARKAGGLAVLAAGRYPSARLDRQLAGRAGRQGDPGTHIIFSCLDDEVVTQHADAAELHAAHGHEARSRQLIASSQRIAQAQRLDRHRATWEYGAIIARQREFVLRHRARVLGSAREAVAFLGEREVPVPGGDEPPAELAEGIRRIVLFCLDDAWQRHLAFAQELRDGVHLQALAGRRPLDAFRDGVQAAFHGRDAGGGGLAAASPVGAAAHEPGFMRRVAEDAAERVEQLEREGSAARPELPRPSASWTYMVVENPFGDQAGRAVRGLASMRRRLFSRS